MDYREFKRRLIKYDANMPNYSTRESFNRALVAVRKKTKDKELIREIDRFLECAKRVKSVEIYK